MANTFILSDESINDRGFRILTDGIDTGRFESNPVMLFMHQRSDIPGNQLPIGKWENIRKEDGKLMADPVFDENDAFALQIKRKVERGFIKGASMGVRIKDYSTEANSLMKGQSRPTVTDCEVFEASIVDIPANKHTIQLFSKTDDEEILPFINNNENMAKKDDNKLAFASEDELLRHVSEKYGVEVEKEDAPKEEMPDKKSLMAWLKDTFGLTPKDEQPEKEEELSTQNKEVEQLTSQLSEKNKEVETLNATVKDLQEQVENLKNAPGADDKDTAEETDAAVKGDSEILSQRDIELFNLIKH